MPLLYQSDKSSSQRSLWKKKLFVKTLQYSQENACVEVSATSLKKTQTQIFSCEYCEISKSTYFQEHLHAAISEVSLGSDCLGLSFWAAAFPS